MIIWLVLSIGDGARVGQSDTGQARCLQILCCLQARLQAVAANRAMGAFGRAGGGVGFPQGLLLWENRMKRSVVVLTVILMLPLAAWPRHAAAQAAAAPSLNATQTAGRALFAQHCVVCHVKTLVTAVRTYGPALSKDTLAGQEDALREFIGSGTPNMPGFKYSLAPEEIGEIVAYLKTLPAPAPAAPAPR